MSPFIKYIQVQFCNQVEGMAEEAPLKSIMNTKASLRNHLSDDKYQRVFLVLGNSAAGKKTLIHYLLKKKLQPDINDDGEDVLNILEEVQKIVIIEGLLELYADEHDTRSLYIWVNGFPNQSMDTEELIRRALVFQYLAEIFLTFKSKVIFLLVFPLFEDIPQLMTNFHKSFKIYSNLPKHSAFILSKLYDESEESEFIESTCPDLIQANPQLEFLKQILESKRIYSFCSKEPEEDSVAALNDNLASIFPSQGEEATLEIDQNYIGNFLKNIVLAGNEQNLVKVQEIYHEIKKSALRGFQLLNFSLCQVLFAIAKSPSIFQNNFFQALSKNIIGDQITFEINDKVIKQEIKIKQFVKFYEDCRNMLKQDSFKFILYLMDNIKQIEAFWSTNVQQSSLMEYIHQNWIYCRAVHPEKQSIDETFIEVFQNPNSSFLSDLVLSNIFLKIEDYFSEEFAKNTPQEIKSPSKKGVKKITQRKPKFQDYEDQKKNALSQKLPIDKIFKLPLSPLKLDLLLNELKNKMNKKDALAIREIKVLIPKITKILETYEDYETMIKLFRVIPNFNAIEKSLFDYCQKLQKQKKNKKQQIPQEALLFIQDTLSFFYASKRHTSYDLSEANQILSVYKYKDEKKREKYMKKLQQIQELSRKQAFVDCSQAGDIFKDQKKIVEKCIDYEDRNWEKFQDLLFLNDGLSRKCQ